MPQLNYTTFPSQLFWLALTFSVLYLLLARKVLPAIRDVLQARQDRIASDLEKAELARAEAEEAKINYTRSLEQARRSAADKVTQTLAGAKQEAMRRHADLDGKLAAQAEETERRIQRIKAEAEAELAPVTLLVAERIGEKLMGTAFSKEALASAVAKQQ